MADERTPELEIQVRQYAELLVDSVPPVTAEEAQERAERRRWRSPTRWLALAAAVAMVAGLAAVVTIGGDGEEETSVAAGDYPLTLDGHRDWFLDVLNGRDPSDTELEGRLAGSFLAAVPPEQFRRINDSVQSRAPWRVLREVERRDEQTLAIQLVNEDGDQLRLSFAVGGEGKVFHAVVLSAVPCGEVIPAGEAELAPPLAERLDWALVAVNGGGDFSDEELASVLAPSFIDGMPPPQFRAVLERIREIGPLTQRHYEDRPTETALFLRVGVHTGEEARLTLNIERDSPHRIIGFAVLTQQPCRLPTS